MASIVDSLGAALYALPLATFLADGGFRLLFLLWAPRRQPSDDGDTAPADADLLAVVPAHQEQAVIGDTVAALRAAGFGEILVIADRCEDDTAAIARAQGATVYERSGGPAGKGAALRWLIAETSATACRERLAVFDADSQPQPGAALALSQALESGAAAAQGLVVPLAEAGPWADLAAYSELVSQWVDDRARQRLGWPVPLRGTGMAWRLEAAIPLLEALQTEVEDIELTLLLAERGAGPRFASRARVGDPKPAHLAGAAAQRGRWLHGQRQVLRRHRRTIGHLVVGSPATCSLVFACLLKPKTLVGASKLLWAGLGLALAVGRGGPWPALASLAGLAVVLDGVYLLAGLAFVPEPRRYARALAAAPKLLAMWLLGLLRSLAAGRGWLRAREG